MSFSLPPAETLAIILDEPSLCNQTITFGGESIDVNKSVLAAHSAYFRSLWFLEFGDKLVDPIDFSHLPVDSDTFFAFIKSFFGKSFTLNESNAYNFFYLVHYFQVDKLIAHVENHLNTHLVTWAWLKPFIKEADKRNDLRALEFVGPFFSKIDDLLIDDVMAITTEGFKTLVKYCTATQSQSWFIKSMVESTLNQSFDLNELLNILNSCSIEAFCFQQWDELLFVPLKDVEELEADLMKFLFTKVKNLYFDSLVKEVCELKTEVSELTTKINDLENNNSDLNSITTDLTTEVQVLKTEISGLSKEVHDSKAENSHLKTTNSDLSLQISSLNTTNSNSLNEIIKLQQEIEQLKGQLHKLNRNHSQLQVSGDKKRVVVGSGDHVFGNILGEVPLLPGNVYTWKLRYQGDSGMLFIGVIDESKFRVDSGSSSKAHCFENDAVCGCLSGNTSPWNPGELLEINVNLVNHTLTIKSVSNSSINLTGTLPKLISGNYYPYAWLFHRNHVLEIVE
ncbi:hypothetical protein GEMRC1_000124 [Eukaryota sp. GEM-RC1]